MSSLPFMLSALALMQTTPITEAGKAVHAEETARLANCLTLVETDPEAAYEDGLAWLSGGGRPGARHCTAVALIALGHPEEGAARLEDLANAPDAGGLEERALYLTKAGNAWLLAGAPEAALVTLDNALKLKPGETGLLKDRATARLSLEQWQLALNDLDAILEDTPGDVEALELRARARKELGQYDDALADIAMARSQLPDNIDLLVLRGDIREAARLAGN
ncbi:MAG: tetratricopeptide repeat protein [Hyphomonadaceae bacterium]|nr:tetratricopeptide repeat protein [Hyphomonadaceae bacterium]